MARLTLNISDNHLNFFLELIKRFDFVKVESKSDELTDEQKNILDERLENYKTNSNAYTTIEETKEKLKTKYDL